MASTSPRPTGRPAPARPASTPLPTLEIVGGRIPTERRLVYGSGLQVLDLATGTLTPPTRPGQDPLLPLGDDQLVCACVVPGVAASGDPTMPSPVLRFGRYHLTGTTILELDLLTLDGIVPVPEVNEGYSVSAALDAEQRNLFVLAVMRRPPIWTVELHVIDVDSGELVDSAVLDSSPVDLEEPRPSASPRPGGGTPDGVYAWANAIAASPDGSAIYVWVGYSEVRNDNWTNRNREWMVSLRDGTLRTPKPLDPTASLSPDGWCVDRPTFVDSELLVQVCVSVDDPARGEVYFVRRVTTAGEPLEDLPIREGLRDGGYPATAVVDRERRAIFVWDLVGHHLFKVDFDVGRVEEEAVSEVVLPGDRRPDDRGYIGADPGLVASPDGLRLYALGVQRGPGQNSTSSGVWVFDSRTLGLLDHWEPRALLTSLAISADGQFVYAVGAAGLDVDGFETQWPASVTVYDANSGEIQVVYGAVADTWFYFATWP